MKTLLMAVIGMAAVEAGAIGIENVTAQQRWPWNNLVDVDYEITGAADGDEFLITLTATSSMGTKSYSATTYRSDPIGVAGQNRLTWDFGKDYPNVKATDLEISVTATPFTNSVSGGVYMVIDLAEGKDAKRYPVWFTTKDPVHSVNAEDACKTTEFWFKRIKVAPFKFMSADTVPNGLFTVKFTKDFYMGVFETTQQQWFQVMGTWPSFYTNLAYRATRPAEKLPLDGSASGVFGHNNWPTKMEPTEKSFVGRMRAKTGLASFNLPTEAQWEFANRCGYNGTTNPAYKQSEICFNRGDGDASSGLEAGPVCVGTYPPNPWGLYEMFGNANEMCADSGVDEDKLPVLYADEIEQFGFVTDPIGPPNSGDVPIKPSYQYVHVVRGAYWGSSSGWLLHRKRHVSTTGASGKGARFVVTCR